MSSVMPRSWPTTMPLVTTSTVAAAVGEQLGDRRGVVEADLVDHHDVAERVRPRRRARRGRRTTFGRRRPAPTTGGPARRRWPRSTWSGRRSLDQARATRRRRTRSSTPSRRHSVSWLRTRSPNSARLGTDAARRTCPPGLALALVHRHRVAVAGGGDGGLQAGRTGADDQHAPRRPPRAGAGRRRSTSRPVRGFSMQPSQRLRPIRPTHSWLHDRHSRISSVAPARALAAKSASAIWPRTTPTRSQWPSASARSAWSGSLNRPTPTTGRSTALRMARRDEQRVAGRHVHRRLDHEQRSRSPRRSRC